MNAKTLGREGGYNCVVCIKQVPDTKKVTGQAMKADGTINRAALPAIFNPEDRNALEAALRVKEWRHGDRHYNGAARRVRDFARGTDVRRG